MYDRMGRWLCIPSSPHPCPTREPGIHPTAEFVGSIPFCNGDEKLTWHCPVCGLTFSTYLYTTDLMDHDVWGVEEPWLGIKNH